MKIYTIYDHPSDYPDNFVTRCYTVLQSGLFQASTAVLSKSLEEARTKIPLGFYMIPRHPTDDPVIVESWI